MNAEPRTSRQPLTASLWEGTSEQILEEVAVGEVLRRAAADAPDVVALVEGSADPQAARRWTYAALLDEAERAARALLAIAAPGARIAVWANNIPEWVVLEYAAALAGMTIVTVNPALRAGELRHVLSQSRAEMLFMVDEYRGARMMDTLAEIQGELPALRTVVRFAAWKELVADSGAASLPMVAPDAPAQVQYTSGTTGTPKGAVLRHRGVANNARLFAQHFGLTSESVLLSPMPLFHTAGCVMSVLGALAARATLVLPPAFEPGLFLELVERERADSLMGVPTMLLALMEDSRLATTETASVRRVLSGGAVVAPEVVRRVEAAFGAPCIVVFAQTEASPVITQTTAADTPADRAYTLGRPLPGGDVRIAAADTHETLPIGEIGEICTRGYHVMAGYLDLPEMTAAAIDPDGWLLTGDLGSMDERGYCRIEGRLKDMIIRGGENIYPREIEEVLAQHPAVADAAVVGIPDARWGEQVAAFVRLAPGEALDEEALFAHCREQLSPHKTPRRWIAVEAFPLTGSGKVQKHLLRDRLAESED